MEVRDSSQRRYVWKLTCLTIVCLLTDSVTPAIDIYSFGMCALEMAALEIQGNGDSGTIVTEENVRKTIESLDDAQQKDFIRKCLQVDPLSRPSARELLFHPVLFEVHSLKLLSAHALVNSASKFHGTHISGIIEQHTWVIHVYNLGN